jgi:hypothetical protein
MSIDSRIEPKERTEEQMNSTRECVICMADDRDTLVLPCRHMCLCKSCAEVLRGQSNKCPICRQGSTMRFSFYLGFHSLVNITRNK